MDILKSKFSKVGAEKDSKNNKEYEPSMDGDSAIYWSENPEREYLAAVLTKEREKRVAQGKSNAYEDSFLGPSTKDDDEPRAGADYTLESFDRGFTTPSTKHKEGKRVGPTGDNVPPSPIPASPGSPASQLFEDDFYNIKVDVRDDDEPENDVISGLTPPSQQHRAHQQPPLQFRPPNPPSPKKKPPGLIPSDIYFAGGRTQDDDDMEQPTRGGSGENKINAGSRSDSDDNNTFSCWSLSTVSWTQVFKENRRIMPLTILFIFFIAVLIASIVGYLHSSRTTDSATNSAGYVPNFPTSTTSTSQLQTDPLDGSLPPGELPDTAAGPNDTLAFTIPPIPVDPELHDQLNNSTLPGTDQSIPRDSPPETTSPPSQHVTESTGTPPPTSTVTSITTPERTTYVPAIMPTSRPTLQPISVPTPWPTSGLGTSRPTFLPPASWPTSRPTVPPAPVPTSRPTSRPTFLPVPVPTVRPTSRPTFPPVPVPTVRPTSRPTVPPSTSPTPRPTRRRGRPNNPGTQRPTQKGNRSRCNLPEQIGPCNVFMDRFYFNIYTGKCEKFRYGGCGGNRNNFLTKAGCKAVCIH